MKEGDANTKLIHSLVCNRRNKSIIGRTDREDGEEINDSVEMMREIVAFYEKLYKEETNMRWSCEGIDWKQISREKAVWCERAFQEEIKAAVFSCDKEKLPGTGWHFDGVLYKMLGILEG